MAVTNTNFNPKCSGRYETRSRKCTIKSKMHEKPKMHGKVENARKSRANTRKIFLKRPRKGGQDTNLDTKIDTTEFTIYCTACMHFTVDL